MSFSRKEEKIDCECDGGLGCNLCDEGRIGGVLPSTHAILYHTKLIMCHQNTDLHHITHLALGLKIRDHTAFAFRFAPSTNNLHNHRPLTSSHKHKHKHKDKVIDKS